MGSACKALLLHVRKTSEWKAPGSGGERTALCHAMSRGGLCRVSLFAHRVGTGRHMRRLNPDILGRDSIVEDNVRDLVRIGRGNK